MIRFTICLKAKPDQKYFHKWLDDSQTERVETFVLNEARRYPEYIYESERKKMKRDRKLYWSTKSADRFGHFLIMLNGKTYFFTDVFHPGNDPEAFLDCRYIASCTHDDWAIMSDYFFPHDYSFPY